VLAEIVGSAPATLRKHYQHVSGQSRIDAIENIRSAGLEKRGNTGNTKINITKK